MHGKLTLKNISERINPPLKHPGFTAIRFFNPYHKLLLLLIGVKFFS